MPDGRPEVVLYTTDWCGWCARARRLFEAKGVPYREIDIEAVEGARAEMQRRSGRTSVPQIWIGTTHVGGCDDLYALERAGKLDGLLKA